MTVRADGGRPSAGGVASTAASIGDGQPATAVPVVPTDRRGAATAAPRHVSARALRTARSRGAHGAARVVLDAAAAVGLVCALTVVVLLLAGWRPVVLVSGSMGPGMPTGTLVLTRPVAADDVRVGDVVTLPVPGSDARVTHRVTALTLDGGTTWATLRGDANDADDAVPYPLASTVLRAAASVPGLGRAVTGTPATVLVVGAAALVVVALLPGRGTDPDRPGRRGRSRESADDTGQLPRPEPPAPSPTRPAPPAPTRADPFRTRSRRTGR